MLTDKEMIDKKISLLAVVATFSKTLNSFHKDRKSFFSVMN